MDPTVLRYVGSVITVTLNVLLVIGILGYFGIQTTTFAALIAAAGVAIGVAWSGLFTTTINTPDNVQVMVGNNKVFADNIQNFSHNAYRRVDS